MQASAASTRLRRRARAAAVCAAFWAFNLLVFLSWGARQAEEAEARRRLVHFDGRGAPTLPAPRGLSPAERAELCELGLRAQERYGALVRGLLDPAPPRAALSPLEPLPRFRQRDPSSSNLALVWARRVTPRLEEVRRPLGLLSSSAQRMVSDPWVLRTRGRPPDLEYVFARSALGGRWTQELGRRGWGPALRRALEQPYVGFFHAPRSGRVEVRVVDLRVPALVASVEGPSPGRGDPQLRRAAWRALASAQACEGWEIE